jgi:hypothetical protein
MSNKYTSIIDGFTKPVPKPAPRQVYAAPQPTNVAPRPSIGKKQKIVEVTIEKPVIVHKYIDIPEEVVVEKPVERRVEQEVYTERVVEVPREHVIEQEVEVVREEIKEIVIEKRVEFEKFIDVPIERVVEKPIEYVREVDVRVPIYKDKVIDRNYIKPIETVVQEVARYVDKPIYQDRVVERKVEVPIDKVVERVQERRVEVPIIKEVEKVYHVDKVVEIPIERPYEVVVDKVYTREVEVPVKRDKYVDKPYDVVVEKVVQVPREIVKENRVTVTVDKIVEVPVERVVEVPVRNEKRIENVYAVTAERPVFTPVPIDFPVPVTIDKPVQVNKLEEVATERIVERRIDVPYGRVVERPVVKDLTVEVQRIVETNQNIDRNIDIPVQVDKFVEVFKDDVKENQVVLQKVIERPKVVPKVVDRYVDKHVDVKIEIPIPKIVEVPRANYTDKVVDANIKVQKARYLQRSHTAPINTLIRGQKLSHKQKQRFHESSQLLASAIIENEKLKAEALYLKERSNVRANAQLGLGMTVTQAEIDKLRRVVADLESSLRNKEAERNRLRSTTSTSVAEIDVQTRTDGQDIPKLQDHIRRVKAENESLKRLANKGKFESTRNFVGQRVSSALGGTATGIHQFANAFRTTASPTVNSTVAALPIAPVAPINSFAARSSNSYVSSPAPVAVTSNYEPRYVSSGLKHSSSLSTLPTSAVVRPSYTAASPTFAAYGPSTELRNNYVTGPSYTTSYLPQRASATYTTNRLYDAAPATSGATYTTATPALKGSYSTANLGGLIGRLTNGSLTGQRLSTDSRTYYAN